MSGTQLARLSGAAVVVGAVLAAIGVIISTFVFPEGMNPSYPANPLFVPLNLSTAVGAIFLLLGLPGLYASQATRSGVIGVLGMVLVFIGIAIFGIFLSLLSALIFPFVATQAPQLAQSNEPPPGLIPVFVLGTAVTTLGPILFGIPMLRGEVLRRWVGILLVVSGVFSALSFFTMSPDMQSPISVVVNVISPALLFIALGWLGWRLWTGAASA
jgi:hypothetical protein